MTGGTPIISYQLQRTSADGTGFFDVIGSYNNLSLTNEYTVTGLEYGKVYRFRYRAINAVGVSGWSLTGYLIPASVPDSPGAP